MKMKEKIVNCVAMILLVLAMTNMNVMIFGFLNTFIEATQHINYDNGIELIQANKVKEIIVYPFSVEICCDDSYWNYTFEFPDRKIFLEFIQEEIEDGNTFRLKKGDLLSIRWVNNLMKCMVVVAYIVEMYIFYKITREIIFYKEIEIPEEEKIIRAYHEAGHALVVKSLKINCNITKISILPDDNGNVAYIYHNATESRVYIKKTEFIEHLVALLAGRAAEKEVLGENSSMCFDDLVKANNIAKEMVTIYGMDDIVGPMSFWDEDSKDVNLVESDICNNVENQIQKLLKQAENKATEIIRTERNLLDKIAKALLEKETLLKDDLKEIFEENVEL